MSPQIERDFPIGHPAAVDTVIGSPEHLAWIEQHKFSENVRDFPPGHAKAVDTAGNAYAAGQTLSTNFPTRGPIQSAFAGGAGDAFILKVLTPPSLAVAIIGNTIVITWPAPSPEFVLEMSNTVGPTAIWTRVLTSSVVTGGRNTVTLPISAAPQFFRLRGL